jgi:CHAT domain-containing protein/lipopolysaccharide biosynthesis regulator YciM
MNLELSWLRLVPLVALLWGLPTEVRAELSRQEFFGGRVEKLETTKYQQPLMSAQQPFLKQTIATQKAEVKQNVTEQDILFQVDGSLAEGDALLGNGSLHDVQLFEGQAGQIVRITLTSGDFDAFLLLQNTSGEELARNDDSRDGANAEILIRLPTMGQYRILASTYNESGRGDYLLTVETSDENALHQFDLKVEADRLFEKGISSFQINQYREALDSWQKALEIYHNLGDLKGEAASLGNLSIASQSLGDYQQAIDFLQQSLAIARDLDNRQDEANSLGNLGDAYESLGEYQRAIDFYQQALVITRDLNDRQIEANSLGGLGNVYQNLGDYQQAIDFQQQALAIKRDLDDRRGEAIALGGMGNAYESLGEYTQAIDSLQQSLVIARDLDDRQIEANSLGSLGVVYYSLGDYQQAIDFQQQSLAIKRDLGDRQGEANALSNLGNAYQGLGDYQQAIDFYQQSLAISRALSDRKGEENSLSNLGIVYYSLGDYQKAIDFQQQSLAIARSLGNRQGEAISLGNLGNAYRNLGNYQQAIDFHQQALVIAHDIDDRQGEAISLNSLGIVYLTQKKAALAEEVLAKSINILDGLRSSQLPDRDRINLFEIQAQTYRNLELALAVQNKFSEALEVADRGRARSFVQIVSEKLSENREERILANPLSFSEMQKVAEEQQSVLVEYSLVSTTEDSPFLYIWVMQPTGELDFRQVSLGDDPDRLSKLVSQSRESIGVRGRGFTLASGPDDVEATDKLRELHKLMIETIADLLPSDPEQRVVFIPQGQLFLVPFAALVDESGMYLIKQHTILTAPSIQMLNLTRQQANSRVSSSESDTNLLAIGNPVMPEVWNPEKAVATQLPSLTGAAQEAKNIAALFNTEALLGADATESTVKQQIGNARIVHLATHGLLDYGTPEESGVRDVPGAIALAPGNGEDGLLTSAEIINELTLQADLVVLSACDTGLGAITGDGVIGLSRSLIAAGTPSVIASLWSIPDAPTAELMTEFYRQRQQGKDKAQSLRQAMLVTMESHPNPGDWAAFTLIGEAD